MKLFSSKEQRPSCRFFRILKMGTGVSPLLNFPMKKLFFALIALLVCGTAHAQWKTETYTLKGGWNAIYLHGDASYDAIDNIFPNSGTTANITEIWCWNPNPDAVQFMDSQMIPSAGTAEWSVWKRGVAAETTLTKLVGQHAYLVKCLGTVSSSYTVTLKQSPQLPSNSWVRNGANLLGFPTYKNGSIFPTFASYFATFPAAIASSSKIFKYAGGDLSSTNPIQLFSTTSERVDRNQAYWFSAKVAGEYYAPLEFSLSNSDGLSFGRTRSEIKLRIRNRTSAVVTVTLAPTNSEAEPAYQTAVAGPVALTNRAYNAATAAWTETAMGASSTQVIAPQTTIELSIGIDRTAMTGAANSYYASLLRITESSSLMDVYLPVTAYKASLAGLWVGDIRLNSVSSKVSNPARATATLTNGVVTGLAVDGSGGFGYTTAPTVTLTAPASNDMKLATATAAFSSVNRTVTSITSADSGFGYATVPTVTIGAPTPSAGASFAATLSGGAVSGFTTVNAGVGYQAAPTVTISAPPASTNATADAVMNGKTVSAISVIDGGGYYSAAPTVAIGAPAARTTATATMGGTAANWTISKGVSGTGYATPPAVTITGGTGSGATATATLGLTADNFSIVSGDMSYSVAPTVTISGGGSPTTPATATAILTNNVVTGITITSMGAGYTTAPTLTFSGGTATSGTTVPTAVGNAAQFAVSTLVKGANGTYTVTPTTATIAAPPAPVQAVATAAITNGVVSGVTLSNGGSGYLSTPTVTISGGTFVTPVTATATATLSGAVVSLARTVAGAGYLSPPTVTLSSPPPAIQATTTATISNNRVTGYTVTNPGLGYFSAPTVTLSAPTLSSQPATAIAQVSNGAVSGFTIISGGSGYAITPEVTISAPPAQSGTATPGTFKMRTLLHVADDGTAKLLSKVYLGKLAVAPNNDGISTSQSLLQASSLSTAHRLSAGHLPTGRVITGSGTVALGSSLACAIALPYDDPTNPFVHQFHPDHDNKNARFEPAAEGVESYTINRATTFNFTTTPPSGGTVAGWGSTVIGGTYSEVISGLHSSSIQLSGTFELRRASEIGTLSQ